MPIFNHYTQQQQLIPKFFSFSVSRIRAHVEQSQLGDAVGKATIHLRALDVKNVRTHLYFTTAQEILPLSFWAHCVFLLCCSNQVEPGMLGLGRSDPFFEIAKKNADHEHGIVRWYVALF